ncbi:MAG: hypothetical protein ACKOA3_02190 [Sphingomonadales bacterium]
MQPPFAHFSLTLINTKKKQYETLGWWVVVLNAIIQVYVAVSLGGTKQGLLLYGGLIGPLIALPLNRLLHKKKSTGLRYSDLTAFYIFGIYAWMVGGFFKSAGVLLILFILFKISLRSLRVVFSDQGIDYPSIPRKKIEWNQVAQVIVKDDLLTIDLRSNRLLQHPIEKNSFIDDREVIDFNAHCQQKINPL